MVKDGSTNFPTTLTFIKQQTTSNKQPVYLDGTLHLAKRRHFNSDVKSETKIIEPSRLDTSEKFSQCQILEKSIVQ